MLESLKPEQKRAVQLLEETVIALNRLFHRHADELGVRIRIVLSLNWSEDGVLMARVDHTADKLVRVYPLYDVRHVLLLIETLINGYLLQDRFIHLYGLTFYRPLGAFRVRLFFEQLVEIINRERQNRTGAPLLVMEAETLSDGEVVRIWSSGTPEQTDTYLTQQHWTLSRFWHHYEDELFYTLDESFSMNPPDTDTPIPEIDEESILAEDMSVEPDRAPDPCLMWEEVSDNSGTSPYSTQEEARNAVLRSLDGDWQEDFFREDDTHYLIRRTEKDAAQLAKLLKCPKGYFPDDSQFRFYFRWMMMRVMDDLTAWMVDTADGFAFTRTVACDAPVGAVVLPDGLKVPGAALKILIKRAVSAPTRHGFYIVSFEPTNS